MDKQDFWNIIRDIPLEKWGWAKLLNDKGEYDLTGYALSKVGVPDKKLQSMMRGQKYLKEHFGLSYRESRDIQLINDTYQIASWRSRQETLDFILGRVHYYLFG